ncbi:urease accessory protein UreD [Celeribacter halophilus]|uniref:urease accessory protein UreD n=1 Tax=Celeribacter halophilus TaxID=576117 RepID=UPI001C08ADA0|nr:urease accessory protein UreD [Celeribacter halophilus]MBU2889344.1 urease accessory protein UreD [Celeribacter halophilus]MDO6509418.1 urease accessory protein UreD [Celeribacter halophilus]
MLDRHHPQTNRTDTARMQRVRGRAHVVMGAGGLKDLHQSGSAKAMMPKVHSHVPEVVFLNTSGGLTAGDQLDYRLEVEAGGQLIGTTQTAERAYASVSQGANAEVSVALVAGAGATLEWLPQETILFERSRLSRRTKAEIAGDARFLFVESLVLGRAAMGEVIESLHLTDRRDIRRAGRLEFMEPLEIDAGLLATRDHPATLNGARAIATVGLFDQGAEGMAGLVKQITQEGVTAGVSGWNGKLVIRAMAADGYPLRRYVAQVLKKIRQAELPRVWQV